MKKMYLKDFFTNSHLENLAHIHNQIEDFDKYFILFDESQLLQVLKKQQYYFLKKGEEIGALSFCKKIDERSVETLEYHPKLVTPDSAYYDFSVNDFEINRKLNRTICVSQINDDVVICGKAENEDLANDFINRYCSYEIIKDLFDGEKRIVWKNSYYQYGLLNKDDAFQLRFSPQNKPDFKYYPYVILNNAKEQFAFQFEKKEFTKHRFVKGDTFHFVFENNKHLEYQLKKLVASTNDSNYKQVSFSMLPQDIKLFASENLIAIRCEFQNGDAPIDLKKENDLASLTFKLYFQKYIKALSECGVNIDAVDHENEVDEVEKESSKSIKEESCFVYLMKDESNGYHKIGISNKPEYRERTLQSEKPTIVLLCAKEFPTRIISEAIESALHKAFEAKRLRGEWFDLNEKDVLDITRTLS